LSKLQLRSSFSVNLAEAVMEDDGRRCPASSPLRKIVFGLMIDQPPEILIVPVPRSNPEIQKFTWLFPKILTIFLNGLPNETITEKFLSFKDVIDKYLLKYYQTVPLAEKFFSSLISTADSFEDIDGAVKLFCSFFNDQYDMCQFRFFSAVLQYSICYSNPI
jgi:hypothetical protein